MFLNHFSIPETYKTSTLVHLPQNLLMTVFVLFSVLLSKTRLEKIGQNSERWPQILMLGLGLWLANPNPIHNHIWCTDVHSLLICFICSKPDLFCIAISCCVLLEFGNAVCSFAENSLPFFMHWLTKYPKLISLPVPRTTASNSSGSFSASICTMTTFDDSNSNNHHNIYAAKFPPRSLKK